jgi:hypothetical protein
MLCRMEQIKALVDSSGSLEPPKLALPSVDLSCYDALLHSPQEVA